ncbi:DUF747-domain-containing protein [Testicularia cyperi]|uniref:DUF747-domain-containing protein n=1 Tax=Testicularia cyperi TaxID=1882483 RepID=A0A317Y2K2_9BASI|nr:DUF747-domain-containing protein [Testicularia cyperi]
MVGLDQLDSDGRASASPLTDARNPSPEHAPLRVTSDDSDRLSASHDSTLLSSSPEATQPVRHSNSITDAASPTSSDDQTAPLGQLTKGSGSDDTLDVELPPAPPYKTAPVQVILQDADTKDLMAGHRDSPPSDSDSDRFDEHQTQAVSRSPTRSPSDSPARSPSPQTLLRHRRDDRQSSILTETDATENSGQEDDCLWEDEDEEGHRDLLETNSDGHIVYDASDFDDSASDLSNNDVHQEEDDSQIDRHAYRKATQQYRRSRRALLLSQLSSFASSPSDETLASAGSPLQRQASDSSEVSLSAPTDGRTLMETYLDQTTAEPVDDVRIRATSEDVAFFERLDTEHTAKHPYNPAAGSFVSNANDSHLSFESDDSGRNDAIEGGEEDHGAPASPQGNAEPHPDRLLHLTPKASRSSVSTKGLMSPAIIDSRRSSAATNKTQNGTDLEGQTEDKMGLEASTDNTDWADAVSSLTNGGSPARPSSKTLEMTRSAAPDAESAATAPATTSSGEKRRASAAETMATNTAVATAPFSLWDYLQEEVMATDFDSTQELKWERVTNFISIPFWMEKIIMFGFIVCLDSFLYTFTILPLRFGVAMWRWVGNTASWMCGGERRYLHSSHKCDILKMLLIVLSCVILSRITDASKMYHSVRGQDVVKLSVIFNVLEIADRLCCSFGQDLLDSLFSRTTLARRKNGKQPYLRPMGFFCLSLCYVLAHTLVLFYQLVTLNVAINSYDNALLTLLLSNQFVEIKSSVFKKFEKENVFQMTCADIVERFQLTLMLSAIALRNLIELSGGSLEGGVSPLPASFTVFPSLSLLETILTPVCIVLLSECVVDWLKHAFITKFNHIRPAVYGRFMDVLCRDLVVGGPSTRERSRKHTFVDQSPIVSRRLGFAALPLACLLVRLILQIIGMIGDTSHIDECAVPLAHTVSGEGGWVGTVARKLGAVDIDNDWIRAVDLFVRGSAWALTTVIAWAFLVAIKLLLGTNLVSFASHRYATMHEREVEESLNAKDRQQIGTNSDERSYDKKLGPLINKLEDDAVQIMLDGTHVAPGPSSAGDGKGSKSAPASNGSANNNSTSKDQDKAPTEPTNKRKESSLMDVSRYTMVRSRIW